jgi:hypothetical protein
MSILGGLVDEHHETELSPSTTLVKPSWFARHFFLIVLIGCALGALVVWH